MAESTSKRTQGAWDQRPMLATLEAVDNMGENEKRRIQ